MRLPEKPARKKRNETRDLVHPIVVELNKLPGVRVVRNANLGPVVPWAKRFVASVPFYAGLGEGSADIVGICTMVESFGRVFCLEVKLPSLRVDGQVSKRKGRLQEDQERWLAAVRRFGGFAAVVMSIDEAVACVESCRRGEDGSTPF